MSCQCTSLGPGRPVQCPCCGRCCRCTTCPCCGRPCPTVQTIETVYYAVRFVDVPMQVYYGPGYTELDCCIANNEALQSIATSLKR